MAKILVADDNSNVQKTVALALADLGVEIVSVNNGEAAVRKLADFSPDLVLADIFMPVRNGYEVCEFVKKDARFAQVPVVLLVGAFDPLDEREAQRVGADGILKKPFVPPDPLITMVKTLLERTLGEHLVAVSVSTPVTVQSKTERAPVEAPLAAPAPFDEAPEPVSPAPLRSSEFEAGQTPVAFGQLLDTASQDSASSGTGVIEPVDDEQILTSQRDATLGDPIFWRNDSPEPEPEADADAEENSAGIELHAWGQGENSLPLRDKTVLVQPIEPLEPLEIVREGQDEPSPSIVDSDAILLDPAVQSPLNVESQPAPGLAANPLEWMATAPPLKIEEPAPVGLEPEEPSLKENPPVATTLAVEEAASAETAPVAKVEPAPEPEPPKTPARSAESNFVPAQAKEADKIVEKIPELPLAL
ncbi:MAG: response regulator, partial [Candidatus Acidiferrales bacterium]